MDITTLEVRFTKAQEAQKKERDNNRFPWDDREDLFYCVYKHPEDKTQAILSTGELTSIAVDGACRVMAQMPSGRFIDRTGNALNSSAMNLLFENYILPNANSGGDMFKKFRMADMFSRVLPVAPVFFPWVEGAKGEYSGPDMVLFHPRRFFPQPGKNDMADMDYFFVEEEKSLAWFEEQKGKKSFKNIDEVIKQIKESEGTGAQETDKSPEQRDKDKTGFTVRHYFTKEGDWVMYCPTLGENKIILDEKKFFCGLPGDVKAQYPVIDSLYGINDFDRGQMVQKSIDSVVRLVLDGYALSVNPPTLIDVKRATLSSIVLSPKAQWYGEAGSVQVQNVNPQAIGNFQTMYGALKGMLLSMSAQQDTSVSLSVDAGMGKTPEAIRAQGDKQGARDSWDRFMMEKFIERSLTFMANMVAKRGVSGYAFSLLEDSTKKLRERYSDDVLDRFIVKEGDRYNVNIPGQYLEGKWKYEIEENSTGIKKDDTGQKMMSFVEAYNKYPGIAQDFAMGGTRFNQAEAFKRAVIDSGIQDPEKIIVEQENPNSVQGIGPDSMTAPEEIEMPMEQGMSTGMPIEAMQGMPQGMPMPQGIPQGIPQEIPSELLTR